MATETTYNNQKVQTQMIAGVMPGVVAGLVGGSVFGVQMAVGGMLPMVAGLVGSESVLVGFIVHMVISAIIGGTFALVASKIPQTLTVQTGAGFVWGIVWWIVGALIIMPIVLGMGEMVLVIEEMQWMSLVGHGYFGIVLGVTYYLLNRR